MPWNDVGGDLAPVGAAFPGDDGREDGEKSSAHADEEVGANACGLLGKLPFEADSASEETGQENAAYSALTKPI